MYPCFINNTKAIIDIPHYLTIVIILLVILIPLIFYGAGRIQRQTQINQLKQDLQTMMTSTELLTIYADHASTLTQYITIPQSVNYVSFQSPTPSWFNGSNDGFMQYNTYQICYDDGYVESFSMPFFIYQAQSEPFRLYQGTHQITIEIISIKDKTYVAMETIE
jgi:hypothetical protein